MPLDWHDYDQFDWVHAQQAPMPGEERAVLERFVADLLSLSEPERARAWGAASPPGRFAATVVHVLPEPSHRYRELARAHGIAEIGVKLFKATADARREARRVLPFHREIISRLPGLPNDHVQRSLDAGSLVDATSTSREFVIQEWVPGPTLEQWVRRVWPVAPIDGARVRSLLEQLFGAILIPLWGEGTVWWDVRDANYCWNEASRRLTLIDADALTAYFDEITRTPECWVRRDKGQAVALARLRQMTRRLLLAQGLRAKKCLDLALNQAWHTELEPCLRALGRHSARNEERKVEAAAALDRFLACLEQADLVQHSGSV